jgi:hypothetical protein
MMKKLILTFVLSTAPIYLCAQETQDNEQSTQKAMSSIPEAKNNEQNNYLETLGTMPLKLPNYGSLVIGCGFNFLNDHPSTMNLNYWRSMFANISLYYNVHLGQSHFTISPGIGIASDGYQFKNGGYVLVRDEESRHTAFKEAREIFPKSTKIHWSAFDILCVDAMLEARFNANIKYPKESFFVALGGKLGMPWRVSTTVKYQEDNETKRQTNREFFNLNKTRYGLYAKLGWGRFGLCYTHMLSNLFQKNTGPKSTTMKTWELGVSIDLF